MPRTPHIDPLAVKHAQAAADEASTIEELRRAQAVLLPALLGATLEQTASALGVGRATVPRLHFRQRSASQGPAPGLPAYAPELNPQEHLWDELREKEFPNRVFADMAGVLRELQEGLPRLAEDRGRIQSICAWPWIVGINWNAQ
jgi:hypothetical protein